ncbi:hypothetical protein SCATT_p08880 (plasmid) [Streptantibioticus cattleyicolor NRRL 8057 = DSM 46488]|uniref:Uncharacterized protein n=1 Tax=Streptantibioticus cattleyicolor (strain ATCC 35852 / DSM 46488 / JCM 4925 / NBRC 14057 / NRRL 8057) TaxID=1003195 RepID=G8XDD5_STREN|nr:hypothetical protein SCATT_p08880 [Streptantibioticus cattleyicolor NRRL 8057 = DSM 46488]
MVGGAAAPCLLRGPGGVRIADVAASSGCGAGAVVGTRGRKRDVASLGH